MKTEFITKKNALLFTVVGLTTLFSELGVTGQSFALSGTRLASSAPTQDGLEGASGAGYWGGTPCYQVQQNFGQANSLRLNNYGDVIGNNYYGSTSTPFAIVNGQSLDLSALTSANQSSWARGINNTGVIVGAASNNNISRGFISANGVISYVSQPGGSVFLESVNDSGDIVGSTARSGTDSYGTPITCSRGILIKGVEYAQGQSIVLPQFSCGSNASYTQPYFNDINNSGVILGFDQVNYSISGYGYLVDPHYLINEFLPSLTPSEGIGANPLAVNNNDVVVGWLADSLSPPSMNATRPAIWKKNTVGGAYELQLLGTTNGAAYDINDAGTVVGTFETPTQSFSTHAFVYQNGAMKTLDSLLCSPLGTNQFIIKGTSINNAGQIIAEVIDWNGGIYSILLKLVNK